jgi:hypothetical protein
MVLRSSTYTCLRLQALAPRIKLPVGFNRPYRDVVKFCKRYNMDESMVLIWIGCLFAKLGPPGFAKLWSSLAPALKHYFYGFNATLEDIDAAAANMAEYAETLERFALNDKVSSARLTNA